MCKFLSPKSLEEWLKQFKFWYFNNLKTIGAKKCQQMKKILNYTPETYMKQICFWFLGTTWKLWQDGSLLVAELGVGIQLTVLNRTKLVKKISLSHVDDNREVIGRADMTTLLLPPSSGMIISRLVARVRFRKVVFEAFSSSASPKYKW